MKMIKLNAKAVFTVIAGFIIILALSSCATKLPFESSAVVPAAEGKVKVKKDKNKNYAIQVTVTHLADPQRLQPSMEHYVVWMETEMNGIKNIGQLKSSGSLLSKTLKGSLNTVTSYRPVKVFVTAEHNANIQYPGTMVVLTTKGFR